MNKGYLLTAITAAALGAGTVQLVDLDARAGIPQDKIELITVVLGAAATNTAEGFIQNTACSLLDAQYALTGDLVCTIPRDIMGRAASLYWIPGENYLTDPEDYTVELRPLLNVAGGGTWSPGAPE